MRLTIPVCYRSGWQTWGGVKIHKEISWRGIWRNKWTPYTDPKWGGDQYSFCESNEATLGCCDKSHKCYCGIIWPVSTSQCFNPLNPSIKIWILICCPYLEVMLTFGFWFNSCFNFNLLCHSSCSEIEIVSVWNSFQLALSDRLTGLLKLISLTHWATNLVFLLAQNQNLLALGNWTWVFACPALYWLYWWN